MFINFWRLISNLTDFCSSKKNFQFEKAHKTDIPTPEKKVFPTIKYGKYIYYYHKDLYLLKEAHQLHKTTLSKKLRDNIMDSKSETEGYLCPVPRCDRIFMNTSVYFTHVEIHNLVGWPKDKVKYTIFI